MRIGVSFPTTEIGNDPNDIRSFAQEIEAMGYDYLTCIDHVIQPREAIAPIGERITHATIRFMKP